MQFSKVRRDAANAFNLGLKLNFNIADAN